MPQLPTTPPKKPSAVQVSRSAHSPQKAPLLCPDRTRPELRPSAGGREIWVETQNRNKNGLRLTCCCKALPPRYLMGAGNEAGRAPGSYNQKRPRTTCCGPAAAPGAPHSLASPAVLPEDTAPPSASSALAPGRGSAVPPPRGVSARLLSRARRLWVFFEGSSYPDRSQIPGCAAVGRRTASPRQAASPARGHPGPPRNNSIIFGCPKLSWRFEPRGTNPTEPTPWAFRCFARFGLAVSKPCNERWKRFAGDRKLRAIFRYRSQPTASGQKHTSPDPLPYAKGSPGCLVPLHTKKPRAVSESHLGSTLCRRPPAHGGGTRGSPRPPQNRSTTPRRAPTAPCRRAAPVSQKDECHGAE